MKTDFFKENAFRIIFVVFFLLAFVWMGTKQTILSNSNSAADWLPSQFQQTRDYNWSLSNFPFESYVVVSWEGCELGDDRIELFAQKLVPQQTIDNYSLSGDSDGFKADLQLERAPEEAKDELDEATGEKTNISTQALVDASGSVIDPARIRVIGSIQPTDIEMTDDVEKGLVQGNIANLIYEGDHYRYVVHTELGQDFVVADEYLWNMDDIVGLIMPVEKMNFTVSIHSRVK